VVTARRALLAAGALVAVLLVGALALLGTRGEQEELPLLRGDFAATTTLEPEAHLFGEQVTARLEVVVDATRVPESSVKAQARFAPYTIVRGRETRERFGDFLRVRQEYVLECLVARCLPPKGGRFRFPGANVEYAPTTLPEPQRAEVDWPALRVASRVGPNDLEALQVQGDVRDLPGLTYRVQPDTFGAIGFILAVLLAAAGLALAAWALDAPRLVKDAFGGRRSRLSPLQRALAVVRRATERGEPDTSRRALDRLSAELRRTREADLARTASGLAWRRDQPSEASVEPLSSEVERVISEDGR
jgi:hypothetical protein